MAITPPVTDQEISSSGWGIPITNEVNRMTPLVTTALSKPPGRIWKNSMGAADGASGFVTVPGSTTLPGESTARKWLIIASLHVDGAQTGVPKVGYTYLYINGSGVDQYAVYVAAANQTFECTWMVSTPTAIASMKLDISNFKTATTGSFLALIDGGP